MTPDQRLQVFDRSRALTELKQACLIGGVGAGINQSSVIPRYNTAIGGCRFLRGRDALHAPGYR